MKTLRIVTLMLIAAITVTAFQNCGETTNIEDYTQSSSSLDEVPVIVTPPTATTIATGQALGLSVATEGQNLRYAWYKNDVAISGATKSSYTIASAVVADSGTYKVTVTNSAGSVSAQAAVTVNPLTPPVTLPTITSQPANSAFTLVVTGSFPALSVFWTPATMTLSASATGTGLSYQWWFDGAEIAGSGLPPSADLPIAGATSPTFTINSAPVRPISEICGKYRLVVSNSAGSVSTNVATVSCIAGTVTYN